MAKFLSTILGATEPMFTVTLRQLESMTGNKGIDIAYIASITQRAHVFMREVGLDPADTTEQELYKALNANIANVAMFKNLSDVGLIFGGSRVISLNLDDVRENVRQSYDSRSTRFMRCQIEHTLADNYRYAASNPSLIDKIAADAGLGKCELKEYHKRAEVPKEDNNVPQMLCIGDIFTDAFIKLNDNSAKVITDEDGKEWLALPFGQKPPYDHVDIVRSVGPSPNAAVSMSRLGLDASLMAWIGGDDVGKEALEYLTEQRVGIEPMVTEQDNKTSYWYVLRYGADRTMLVRSEKYKYEWRDPAVKPDWIYLSYIGETSWQLHEALLDYLERNPEVKLAFQPGTFHFEWGTEKLAAIYRRSEIVLMNREEAMDVTGRGYDSVKDLADGLHELGPKYAVITDGSKGSYASHDGQLVTIENYPDPQPPLDRTGAGDAFASTVVAALALGKNFREALTLAPINSMNVVQHIGAQEGLLKLDQIQEYLGNAPEGYEVREV